MEGKLQPFCLSFIVFNKENSQLINLMLGQSQPIGCPSSRFSPAGCKKIENYEFDTQTTLGKGSYSTVHPGSHLLTQQPLAVKVVKLSSLTSSQMQDLLQQEITTLCSINHPNLIRCMEVLKSTTNCYIITELCEQGTLETLLKKRQRLSEPEIWPYVRDIYQGLRHIAANLFLREGVVKTADFGFAVQARHRFRDGSIGSPLYMSPEGYLQHCYGPKTDVWVFGVIVYELLHGRTPCSHCSNEQDLKRSLARGLIEQDLLPGFSSQIKELLFRCLAVDENDRVSIEDIENLPYFQHKLRPQAFQLGKASSVPSFSQMEGMPRQEYKADKCMMSMMAPRVSFKKAQQRGLTFLTMNQYVKEQSITSACSSHDESFCENTLTEGRISFNQSIGLIHFCRIGFQLVKGSSHGPLAATIKQIIVRVLEDVIEKAEAGMISFAVKENEVDRLNKLKTISKEYPSKYRAFPAQISYSNLDYGRSKRLFRENLEAVERNPNQGKDEVYFMNLLLVFFVFCEHLHRASSTIGLTPFSQDSALKNCFNEKDLFSSPNTTSS